LHHFIFYVFFVSCNILPFRWFPPQTLLRHPFLRLSSFYFPFPFFDPSLGNTASPILAFSVLFRSFSFLCTLPVSHLFMFIYMMCFLLSFMFVFWFSVCMDFCLMCSLLFLVCCVVFIVSVLLILFSQVFSFVELRLYWCSLISCCVVLLFCG